MVLTNMRAKPGAICRSDKKLIKIDLAVKLQTAKPTTEIKWTMTGCTVLTNNAGPGHTRPH